MEKLTKVVDKIRKGNFVLIHDSDGRENETDLVMAAEFVKAGDIAKMRRDGGGLICIAVGKEIAERLELPFLSDLLQSESNRFPVLSYIKADDIPYDEKSSFSLSINYRKTFTGITDNDRALTISEFGKFCNDMPNDSKKVKEKFGSKFRSPGHVPLLISSGLENREGHTELSTALMDIASLAPVAVVCEMLDNKTHKSLSKEGATSYAKRNALIFLEASEVKDMLMK